MAKDPRGDERSPDIPEMIGEMKEGDRGSGEAIRELRKENRDPGSYRRIEGRGQGLRGYRGTEEKRQELWRL